MIGTLVNAGAVLIGGGIGLLFRGRIPKKISEGIVQALGLCVCVIGVSGAMKGDFLLLVTSLALGTLTGILLRIDDGLNRLGGFMQKKLSRPDGEGTSTFAEGFVAASLLFCVGAMSVIGSIESGLGQGRGIIFTKSILDGVSAMVFASTLGWGVLFSVLVILVYQGGIELFAGVLQPVLTEGLITQISAAGSVMILGLGLNMVSSTKIKAANMLPGLLFAAGYYLIILSGS